MNNGNKKQVQSILFPYQKKWVALNPERSKVIMSGPTLKEVTNKLKDKNTIITYVLPFDGYYSPLCH